MAKQKNHCTELTSCWTEAHWESGESSQSSFLYKWFLPDPVLIVPSLWNKLCRKNPFSWLVIVLKSFINFHGYTTTWGKQYTVNHCSKQIHFYFAMKWSNVISGTSHPGLPQTVLQPITVIAVVSKYFHSVLLQSEAVTLHQLLIRLTPRQAFYLKEFVISPCRLISSEAGISIW